MRFEIVGGKFETLILQLRGGAVDVAIGFDAAFADWKDVTRHAITPFEATMFVRKGHPLLEQETLSAADVARFPVVSPSDSRPYGETIRNIFESEGEDSIKHLHIVDFFPIARQIVKTSDAIGVVSEGFFDSAKMRSEFISLSTLTLFHKQPMCCAVRAKWEPKPTVRAFIATMQRALPVEV